MLIKHHEINWGIPTLSVRQVIYGNSQEHIQQCVVTEEHENDEVGRVDHSALDTALRFDSTVHHLVPILAGENLEHREQGNHKTVEVLRWRLLFEVEVTTEQLHTEQREDQDEQEEQKQQRDNGAHRIQQRDDEILERRPIFGHFENP